MISPAERFEDACFRPPTDYDIGAPAPTQDLVSTPASIQSAPDMAKHDEYLATTFPIGARGNTPKLGLLVTSLVADVLAKRHDNVTPRIAINVLDAYQDRGDKLGPLLEAHRKLGVDIDNAWVDTDPANQEQLFADIDALARRGYLRAERTDVLQCADECLRIEMLADAMTVPEGSVYRKDESGSLVCNFCQQTATTHEADVLTMNFPEDLPIPTVYPYHMQKDFDELGRRAQGMKMLVSRTRQTGVKYDLGGKTFNLDIDFFWMNFLHGVSANTAGVALIGSNHVRRHLMTIASLHFARTSELPTSPELKVIMPSYITEAKGFDAFVRGEYLEEADPNALRLLILASMSWMKDSQWAASYYGYIKKRLRGIDWTSRTKTTIRDIEELYRDCEQIRGASIAAALKGPTDDTKFKLRGAIL